MTNIQLIERHKKFEHKISNSIYESLEQLNNAISDRGQKLATTNILGVTFQKNLTPQNNMKMALYYTKWCAIIEDLLLEYEDYDKDTVKVIIDYYLKSNLMKEMSQFGLGWYYDIKFKKSKATLYSVSYGGDTNWDNWLYENGGNVNHMKENGMQSIFRACKEHINRGGTINLKSLSKGFGIDLFKYMHIDKNGLAHLHIIKDAPINFITINNKAMSLQEYMQSDYAFSPENQPQFCVDVSHPRNYAYSTYNNWSKKFLGGEVYISKKEIDEVSIKYNDYGYFSDSFIFKWLESQRQQVGQKAISSRVSPIKDQEVIASHIFWDIEPYRPALKEEMIKSEKCYYFKFDKKEYYELIYYYFKIYAEQKFKIDFKKSYDSIIKANITYLNRYLDELKGEQEVFESLQHDTIEYEEFKEREIQYKDNAQAIDFYRAFKASLEGISTDDMSPKIQLALSFIDWDTEQIDKDWSLQNIYNSKNAGEQNLLPNLYKCICNLAAQRGK
ncbi:hypothetical protein AB0Y38_03825 [Lysinibacillus capsici]|uniref:hypothetical protein n=1 Tax=Lysinibacillus capsici TaxID=2115968 RepID=UPI003F21B550